jgi:protein gp37
VAQKTTISWTDHTFNIAWGCTRVGPGCKFCYAELLARRYGHDVWGPSNPRRVFGNEHWREPLKWNALAEKEKQRHRVFCSSMCDVFEDHATIDQERERLWPLVRNTPWLDWQLLSKRSDRIAAHLPADWGEGYPNVWLGVSIENSDYVFRADHLRSVPATVRFISYEPALGPLDNLNLNGIDWVIYGGESGPHFREHDIAWARDIRRRCQEQGTAFFYKQSAGRLPGREDAIDGAPIKDYPRRRIPLRVVM